VRKHCTQRELTLWALHWKLNAEEEQAAAKKAGEEARREAGAR
jgi:hypothetical protein